MNISASITLETNNNLLQMNKGVFFLFVRSWLDEFCEGEYEIVHISDNVSEIRFSEVPDAIIAKLRSLPSELTPFCKFSFKNYLFLLLKVTK